MTAKSPSETQSLKLRLHDVRVVHVHPMRSQAIVVFTLRDDASLDEYPGSMTLPLDFVEELRLEIGDELTILAQKSKSQYHLRQKKP